MKGPPVKPIIGANRRETRIPIVLPVDENGDYAYDEDGKPIKGKKPLTFTVPRFDCLGVDEHKSLNKAIAEVSDMKDENGEPLSMHERGVETVKAMVRPYVSEAELAVIAKLVPFELEQIAEHITQGSNMTLGELLASTDS
jgi:hypothetical protein